jgi:23S rRNA pseudouridine2605 synthase
MRINRFLARAGVSSRRAADDLIRSGRVSVNGQTVTRLATTVDPERDKVEVDGRPVSLPGSFTYIVMNKPHGIVVTMSDPQGRRTVADLLGELPAGVVPVGRLDSATEGLLILTDDGDLAHRIAHPSFELDKVYEVEASGELSDSDRACLKRGIVLDGRTTSPAVVEVLSATGNRTRARITIHEGRKRQVRRMFEAVNHPVTKLTRVRVGPIELGDLPAGQWRHLSEHEVSELQGALGLSGPEE